jgi:hypothetical protein
VQNLMECCNLEAIFLSEVEVTPRPGGIVSTTVNNILRKASTSVSDPQKSHLFRKIVFSDSQFKAYFSPVSQALNMQVPNLTGSPEQHAKKTDIKHGPFQEHYI